MKYPFDCISDLVFVDKHIETADVILVPGSCRPNAILKAVELYHQRFAPYILPSGGPNFKLEHHKTEWEFLRQVAVENGVPEEAILKEDEAGHTFDNAKLSLKALQENNIPFKKVILVCKEYHSRRALLTYQFVFPKDVTFFIYPVTDYRGIRKDNWQTKDEWIKLVMGEVVKIGKYFEDKIADMVK